MQRQTKHAERRVADTARELTNVLFDTVMSDNRVYTEWKRTHPDQNAAALREAFVRKYWSRALPAARATLAGMLRGPYDSAFKDEIFESLSRDMTLIRGRKALA